MATREWFTVHLDGLDLPSHCVDCDVPTNTAMPMQGHHWDWMTSVCTLGWIYSAENTWLNIPLCRKCPLRSQGRGSKWGAIVGAFAGAAAAGVAWMRTGNRDMALLFAILPPIFAIAGFFWGRQHGYQPPVRLKRYSPKKRTIMIRFDRPEYANRFRESLLYRD